MSNHPVRKTILCIDDDHSMLGYQRALLERRGFTVLTAASARQGLQIALACAVAAVIVDYHMPEMNGHELATEIKRLRPHVPIVMVSSDDDTGVSPYNGLANETVLGPAVRIQQHTAETIGDFWPEILLFGHSCAARVQQADISTQVRVYPALQTYVSVRANTRLTD